MENETKIAAACKLVFYSHLSVSLKHDQDSRFIHRLFFLLLFYLWAVKVSSDTPLRLFVPCSHSKPLIETVAFLEQKLLSRGADWFCWQMTCCAVAWQAQPREYEGGGGCWTESRKNMKSSPARSQVSHLPSNSHLQGNRFISLTSFPLRSPAFKSDSNCPWLAEWGIISVTLLFPVWWDQWDDFIDYLFLQIGSIPAGGDDSRQPLPAHHRGSR